jgi:hypothetical protein
VTDEKDTTSVEDDKDDATEGSKMYESLMEVVKNINPSTKE